MSNQTPPEHSLYSWQYVKPRVCTFSKWACLYSILVFELCRVYLTYCSSGSSVTVIGAQEPQVGTPSSFNQGVSLDWLYNERLSNAVFVSCGSGASSAVRLLLKELVISKGANISAPLTTVYLGGPPLAPDPGLFGIVVFDPLPMVSLFLGCGSLHPQIQHMDPALRWEFESFASQDATFWHSLAKCSHLCSD